MATLTWTAENPQQQSHSPTRQIGGGSTPSNNDTLIINSSSDAIAGAATGLTGITFRVGEGFSGTLGSSSTYLDLDGPLCEFASGGSQAYLTGTWTDFRITGDLPPLVFWT